MKLIHRLLTLTLIISTALFVGCTEDGGTNAPELGEVSGSVTFTGTWPSTGNVVVSVWSSWPPPEGAPAPIASSPALSETSTSYTITGLEKGTYNAITVGWFDPSDFSTAKLIGIYWSDETTLGVDNTGTPVVAPGSIEITDEMLILQNVNIKADLGIIQ